MLRTALCCAKIGSAVLPKWADGKARHSSGESSFGTDSRVLFTEVAEFFQKYLEVEQILSDPSELRLFLSLVRYLVLVWPQPPPSLPQTRFALKNLQ